MYNLINTLTHTHTHTHRQRETVSEIVCMYGSISMVANPARNRLNRENIFFLPSVAPKNLVSQDGLGRPVPHHSAHSPHLG